MPSLLTLTLVVATTTLLATLARAICQAQIYKFPLDIYPNARCLDGSPAAIYLQKSNTTNNHKWMLGFEGGGECVHEAECLERAKTGLGSSINYSNEMTLNQLQGCDSTNPFQDWNKVWVKYCSGDLFMGMDTAFGRRVPNLQFSGFQIAKATIDYLFQNHGLNKVEDFIPVVGLLELGLGVVVAVVGLERQLGLN